jgi:DNA-binding NarL/FixJ family response regulator
MIAQDAPDLLISDVRMPGMDGYELARRLRATARYSLIPIVFLSAKDETADRIEGFRSGVDVYLSKPFDPNELIAVIRSVLERVERTQSTIATLVGNEAVEENLVIQDEELTNAEWRIAEAVSRGLSNKDSAAEFNLSVRTIENHVSRILAKKGFANRVEIARHLLSNPLESQKPDNKE